MNYELYGCVGCGSAAVEAALAWLGIEPVIHDLEPWNDPESVENLKRLNPLGQVPTLRLPDGTVMTESAAILLWLAERHGKLLPDVPEKRAEAYRWLVFLVANAYAAISIGDYPERWIDGEAEREALKAGAKRCLKTYWRQLEAAVEPAPFLLGERVTVLDLLVTAMVHWRPGKEWFDQECPKIMDAVRRVKQEPASRAIWARHFPDAG